MSVVFTMRLQSPNWDGHTFTDAAINAASQTLTSNQVGFIAADVGLPITVIGAGVGGKPLVTTVAALISGTQVTLAAAASVTVSNAGAMMGHGSELALPCISDTYDGDSLATILSLFDANNVVMDFRQLREVIVLQGFLTPEAAIAAGYANAINMRDEFIRIRAQRAPFGRNTGAAASWLQEDGTGAGSASWNTNTLPAADQDAATSRGAAKCRLVYDQYWNPSTGAYSNLFVYGTVSKFQFGPRPGATTKDRIPFSCTFLAGNIQVGQ